MSGYDDHRKDLLHAVLEAGSLTVHFQPICSIRMHNVIGVEALARGIDPETGRAIPPLLLFRAAREEDLVVELDRACRRKALESFGPLHRACPNLALFVNFDVSIIDQGVLGTGMFAEYVRAQDLPSSSVVIEMIESRVRQTEGIEQFVRTYKREGFLFALDDLGTGHSNLERIAILKPDILKIDRSICHDLTTQHYKREIFTALVNLGHKIGAMLVAEGIETEDEALGVLELGADLIQGYYLAHPGPMGPDETDAVSTKAQDLAGRYEQFAVAKAQESYDTQRQHLQIVREILGELESGEDGMDAVLDGLAGRYADVECMYVVDDKGQQVSETIFNPVAAPKQRRFIFNPASRGADHSLKDYVLSIRMGLDSYLTDPYVSLATGKLCRTYSVVFANVRGPRRILCVDFSAEPISDSDGE